MTVVERRIIEGLELRCELREGKPPMVAGYAALFNSLSVDLGGFKERIAPGAFRAALGGDVVGLLNHDANLVLSRQSNGTLRLQEDERGLPFEMDMPDTQAGRDTFALVKRGDVKGTSFAFSLEKGGASWHREGEQLVRTITKVASLRDVGPVTFPAYPETSVATRSLKEWLAEEEAAAARRRRRERLADLG